MNIPENFRLRDLPHDEKRLMQAMAEYGVVVMPGHICAPNRGVGSIVHRVGISADEKASRRAELPMCRCLRLSFVADPALYEPAIIRLKQLIFELCVPKRGD